MRCSRRCIHAVRPRVSPHFLRMYLLSQFTRDGQKLLARSIQLSYHSIEGNAGKGWFYIIQLLFSRKCRASSNSCASNRSDRMKTILTGVGQNVINKKNITTVT